MRLIELVIQPFKNIEKFIIGKTTECSKTLSMERVSEAECLDERMYTGYWIEDGFIYGPERSGEYWIDDGFVWGPRNAGKYRIEGGYIYGPKDSGKFYINGNRIYGPQKTVPWLE